MVCLCPAAACLAQTAGPDPSVTAIRAGKFVDVDAGRVLSNQTIMKEGIVYKQEP